MIRDRLVEEMKVAMRAGDKARLEVVRYLVALVKNAEIELKGPAEDETVVKILKGERKKMNEALAQMERAGRSELVGLERGKVKVVEEFLPEEMSREEIEAVVEEVMRGVSDFGRIMGGVMGRVGSRADGKLVSEVVRAKLGE